MAVLVWWSSSPAATGSTVESILPEFADIKLLEGFDSDGPVLRTPKVKATVRHLATHTSGLAYEFWNANMQRYIEETQHPTVLSGLTASLSYPLQFEPGMGHALYSTALDYVRYLRMYLNGGELDGQRILAASTIDTMLGNQIGDLSIPRIPSFTPLSADVERTLSAAGSATKQLPRIAAS